MALTETLVDLSGIPEDYHEFTDIFSKGKVETLPPHRPYDLKINLEEGEAPPPGRMYSLSPLELEALQIFIDENVKSGFIRPSNSPHGAPILLSRRRMEAYTFVSITMGSTRSQRRITIHFP
jgi:hypothetical protein